MKRLLLVVAAGITLIGSVSAVIFNGGSVAAQSLNDFTISTYDIQYELSKDDQQHSVLRTTETITANFHRVNQNRGIERALPTAYNGHSTHLAVESVQKSNGETWQYATRDENGVKILRIGDPNQYVDGTQVYRITYTQRDVTRFYSDTNRDEFYWDTNGTEWKVPIAQLSVSLKLSDSLSAARQGEAFCYQGVAGSSQSCAITQLSDTTYAASASNLTPGQNVTLALGFAPNTFAQYQPTLAETLGALWAIALVATGAITALVLTTMIILFTRRRNRLSELHTIVVQYIPPKEASVTTSAQVITPYGSVFSAQLIDFAVRHYIAIVEVAAKSTWKPAKYDLEVLKDISTLREEERELLVDMFGYEPKVGERLSMDSLRNNFSYMKRLADNQKKITSLTMGTYALRGKSPVASRLFYRWAGGLGVLAVLTLSPFALIGALVVAVLGYSLHPLTDKGLELRRYLLGLARYIKAAEAERLAFLQGPDTADKVGYAVDAQNPGQLVKLYERVLPYAILFGDEKQWSKRLGEYYQTAQESPDWYRGTTPFNAALFAGALSSFTTSASGYSGGTSSSTGGSSGGGFSGGGGGGGGGGGW